MEKAKEYHALYSPQGMLISLLLSLYDFIFTSFPSVFGVCLN